MSDYYWSSPDAAYSMDYIGNKLACERAPPPCVSIRVFALHGVPAYTP